MHRDFQQSCRVRQKQGLQQRDHDYSTDHEGIKD